MAELGDDVTLRELIATLDDPRKFVGRCFQRMWRSTSPAKDLVLRLGITGKGVKPNYRLERADPPELLETIDDNTHDVAPGWVAKQDILWSTRVMTFEEVAELKRSLEGLRGKFS